MSISPNIPSPQESFHYESTGTPRWIAVLFGMVIAAMAVLGYTGYSTESRLTQELSEQEKQNKILTAQLDQANSRIADLKSKMRSEEHTSELQSQSNLVCRLLLEKKNKRNKSNFSDIQ